MQIKCGIPHKSFKKTSYMSRQTTSWSWSESKGHKVSMSCSSRMRGVNHIQPYSHRLAGSTPAFSFWRSSIMLCKTTSVWLG